jgi:hypothetical protein
MKDKRASKAGYLIALLGIVTLAAMMTFSHTSCSTHHHADELNKIDSLIVINDSVGFLLAGVDTVTALEARKIFSENWSKIKEVVEGISDVEAVRAHESWAIIMQYEANDRSLKKQIRKFNKMNEWQRDNSKQLSNLYQSVKRNKIPEDSLAFYINIEGMAVLDLRMQTEQLIPEMQRTISTLDSLHPISSEALEKYKLLAAKKK